MWWSAALVISIAAGGAVFASVGAAQSAAERYDQTIEVFVATTALSQGQEIAEDSVERQRRPLAFVPASAPLTEAPEARHAARDIEAGEVLTAGNVAPGGAGAIAGQLRPGERAVKVRAGGTGAEPGDRVDLVASFDSGSSSNALVLASGARVLENEPDGLTVAIAHADAAGVASLAARDQLAVAIAGVQG